MWVVGGDGDMLSIGGNHLIHALRRNVNIKILMFNNQIYGLTKGQYSPTSEIGKVTKSTPFGSLDTPFNPISVALGTEASFVARTHDMDRNHMMETFRRAHEHKGAAFVEIYQNCNVFNDGAFESLTAKSVRDDMLIPLTHGEAIRFGQEREKGLVVGTDGKLQIVAVADVGEDRILVHDEGDSALGFMLSRLCPARTNRRRSACSTPWTDPSTPPRPIVNWRWHKSRRAPATCTPSCTRARSGRSTELGRPSSVDVAEYHARTRLGVEEGRLGRHAFAAVGDLDDLRNGCGP